MTDDRIAAVPKAVYRTDFFDEALRKLSDKDFDRVADIIVAIQHGQPLPDYAYRKGIDSPNEPDPLLQATGWMHLHFHTSDDDWLLYAKQYPDYVIFAGIERHKPHFERPYGQALNKRFGGRIAKRQLAIETQRRKAASDPGEPKT